MPLLHEGKAFPTERSGSKPFRSRQELIDHFHSAADNDLGANVRAQYCTVARTVFHHGVELVDSCLFILLMVCAAKPLPTNHHSS